MNDNMDNSFEKLLDLSAKAHGHMCAGQVLGVRMGMLGLSLLGFEAPLNNRDIKKVVIYVEIDRCAADALTTVTGVKLGRRSLKFKDYGLMAATFLRLTDGKAYRISVREDCRDKAAAMLPEIDQAPAREIQAYRGMSADDLFRVSEVKVDLKPEDVPGARMEKVICDRCGAMIRHRREIMRDGQALCSVCAGQAYFVTISELDGMAGCDPVQPR